MVEMFAIRPSWRALVRVLALGSLLIAAGLTPGTSGALTRAQDSGPSPAPSAVPAFRQAQNVAVITIRDMIDSTTEFSVKRRLRVAEDAGADAVVIDLDTPGGEVGAVLEICNALKNSSIANTVAWVNPDAYSGGAIIALACREIIVNDPSSMGDALPVVMGPTGLVKATEVMPREKILPPLLAEVVDSARRFGRDEFLVQAIVVDGIELWQIEETGSVPPKRWCVNEAEYVNLFGASPARGKAALAAATAAPTPSDTPGPADSPSVDPEHAGTGDETTSESGPASIPILPESTDRDYVAPNDDLGTLTVDRSSSNELSFLEFTSDRPVFDAPSDGRYTPVRYVCDGSAPIVLRAPDMLEFEFASATVKDDAELATFFGATNISRLDREWSEALVQFLLNPFVRGGLIALFFLAIFVEMSSPGAIFPGVVAVIAIVLAMAPAALIGMAAWWELAAIGLGIALIAIEAFVIPGFGVFGISGLLLMFGGLVFTFVGPTGGLFPGAHQQSDLIQGAATVVLSLVTAGVGMYFTAKHFGKIPIVGKLVLDDSPADETDDAEDLFGAIEAPAGPPPVGAEGVSDSPLRPSGRAEIEGRFVDVVAAFGFIESGTPIRVVRTDGMNIVVEPIETGDEA